MQAFYDDYTSRNNSHLLFYRGLRTDGEENLVVLDAAVCIYILWATKENKEANLLLN